MRRVFIPQHLQSLPPQLPVGEQRTLTGQSMGTTWTVHYIDTRQQSDAAVSALIKSQLDLVVTQMSTWQPDSTLSYFNAADANSWHLLPDAFFEVMACALNVAAETAGAFDPTIGAVVNAWGFGPQGQRSSPPDATQIKPLLANAGWQKLQLDPLGKRALQPGHLYVDFSGIAKGYSVDLIARQLQAAGIDSYLIEVGGELLGAGIKPDGQPWWVGLESPLNMKAGAAPIVALHGLAVATSGDYRRYFDYQGKHYAHTIDPRTGFPVDNALASVSVLHTKCMMADALATAFTVMGVPAALAYAEKHKIAVLMLEQTPEGFNEHLSTALRVMLE